MAEVERRSKPRKVEPKEDEETEPRGHGLLLAAYFFGMIGILEIMIMVAVFLSNPKTLDPMLYYAVGVTAAIAAGLFLWGKVRGRAPAA